MLGLTSGDLSEFGARSAELDARWRYAQQQRLWHLSRYHVGALDDRAFLAQPCAHTAAADLELARAMRADRLGNRAEAAAAYRAYPAAPPWKRDDYIDGGVTRFARWRASALAE
jgi:hypothetical protein